jgi:hypothetical protein
MSEPKHTVMKHLWLLTCLATDILATYVLFLASDPSPRELVQCAVLSICATIYLAKGEP